MKRSLSVLFAFALVGLCVDCVLGQGMILDPVLYEDPPAFGSTRPGSGAALKQRSTTFASASFPTGSVRMRSDFWEWEDDNGFKRWAYSVENMTQYDPLAFNPVIDLIGMAYPQNEDLSDIQFLGAGTAFHPIVALPPGIPWMTSDTLPSDIAGEKLLGWKSLKTPVQNSPSGDDIVPLSESSGLTSGVYFEVGSFRENAPARGVIGVGYQDKVIVLDGGEIVTIDPGSDPMFRVLLDAPVPEPSSLLLVVIGLSLLVSRKRRIRLKAV